MKIENYKLKRACPEKLQRSGGFTLIEILTVIGILAVVFSVVLYFLPALYKKEALEKESASLASLIREARMLTTNSKDASRFGVHLETDKAVLFEGSAYDGSVPVKDTQNFSGQVYLSSYSLSDGGPDIIFNRLTGETPNYGNIVLSLQDNSASTTIYILKTGVVQ